MDHVNPSPTVQGLIAQQLRGLRVGCVCGIGLGLAAGCNDLGHHLGGASVGRLLTG
jgi:hypothetical protein